MNMLSKALAVFIITVTASTVSLFANTKPQDKQKLLSNTETKQIKAQRAEQLTSEILKNVPVENQSKEESLLTTACKLVNSSGTRFNPKQQSVWQSIVSNKIIVDVLTKLKRTKTIFGHIALAQQAAHIETNLEKLQLKTDLLMFLEQHPAVLQKLQNTIRKSVTSESEFLEACQKLDQFDQLYFKNYGLDRLNNSKTAHEAWTRSNLALPAFLILSQTVLSKFNIEMMVKPQESQEKLNRFSHSTSSEKIVNILKGSLNSLIELPSAIASLPYHISNQTLYKKYYDGLRDLNMQEEHKQSLANFAVYCVYAVGAFATGQIAYQSYKAYTENKETFDNIHKQQTILIATSKLLQTMQHVCNVIEEQPELMKSIPEYKNLKELFNPESKQTSPELKNLIKELLSSSFKTTSSYFFAKTGKVLATYHNFLKLHGEFVPYLERLGTIDMHLSIFELYQEFKNHSNAAVCLPTFVNDYTPSINIDNLWHPLLNPNEVVTNNISMGNGSNNNLILTGPNAGGKTTFLTGLAINLILAQSFGIACAKSFVITPFTKIHSYLDITTNIKEGESLFKAELNRAKDLKQSVATCKNDEKAFTMIDEIFSGTNQEVASDIGFDFAKILGQMPHSMTIITTHIPKLTTLEETTSFFNNYKVADAQIASDGTITYPFKLVPGKSTQNIAREMLEAEGVL